MRNSLKYLYLRYLVQTENFAGIAARAERFKNEPEWLCYALYKLGLHHQAATLPYPASNRLAQAGYIASLSACGCSIQAEESAQNFAAQNAAAKNSRTYAGILATFQPEYALKMLEQTSSGRASDLYPYLLAHTGRDNEAAATVSAALSAGKGASNSELYLLAANSAETPQQQLELTNHYLACYGLEAVQLKNDTLPLGATNLTCTAKPVKAGSLVSILVTAYQSAARIGAVIESLLKQTYHNIEIIIIDDAGNDATGDIVSRLMRHDARVRYLKLPVNVGTFAAKNIGLQYAEGDFVTCQDSDDWAHPRKIECQVQPLLENPHLVCTTSRWVRIQDNGRFHSRLIYPLTRLNPASPLFRKHQTAALIGTWDWVRTGADSEFLERIKAVFGKHAVQSVNKPLTFGAHRAGSLMTAPDTGYNERGLSAGRLKYWEAWRSWHIECLQNKHTPFIPLCYSGSRPFPVPQDIEVHPEDVLYCKNTLIEY